MSFTVNLNIDTILVAIYTVCFLFFNFTTYLISDFYHKKFDNPLTNSGFLAAIVFSLIVIGTLLIKDSRVVNSLRFILIVAATILSSWNSIILYIAMRKVRK